MLKEITARIKAFFARPKTEEKPNVKNIKLVYLCTRCAMRYKDLELPWYDSALKCDKCEGDKAKVYKVM